MLRPHRLHLVLFAHLAALGCVPADATAVVEPADALAVQEPLTASDAVDHVTDPERVAEMAYERAHPAWCRPMPATLTTGTKEERKQYAIQRAKAAARCTCEMACCVCYKGKIAEGRPLLADGMAHTAAHVAVDDASPVVVRDDALAAVLLHAAFEEHASIAAFARTILALMQLGAPLSLLAATQQALADEIRHADDVLAAAIAHGAAPVVFGALPEATTPFADDVARALLDDVLVGGCIGETLAAFRVEARGAAHPSIAALCAQIAEDEARHAALAFATARFVLSVRPELRGVVDAAFADFCDNASVDDVACVAPAWRAAFG